MSVQIVTGYLDGHTPHRLIGLKVTSLSEVDILLPPMLQFAFNIQCIDAQPVNVQRHRVGFVVLRQEGSLALMIDGLSLSYIETSSLLASPATTSSAKKCQMITWFQMTTSRFIESPVCTWGTSSWHAMGRLLRPDHDILLAAHAPEGLPHAWFSTRRISSISTRWHTTTFARIHLVSYLEGPSTAVRASRDVLTTQACLGAYCRGLSGPQHLPLWYFTQWSHMDWVCSHA